MLLSFKTLSEKKTKVKINPKMNDVMEGGMPITMHPYAKGGKVKKAKIKEGNHGEDCDCMQCESKRRKDDVNDGPDVQNEAKVDKGRSDYGKASIRNYRRMGPGHGDPGMFDPSGKRGKTIEKRREEHKARRGVKGAKVPAYKREGFERFVECWKTHKKVGMKMKGGKLVNDCRPKNEEKSYYLDKEAEKRGREREARKAQNKAAAKERAAQKRRSERNALRRQGKYGAVGGYYVTKHMEREEVEYEVMTKKKYADTHKDFKGGTKKEPRVSVYDPKKKATVSRLVKFSEMCCATKPNPKAKKQRVANVGLTSEATLKDVMTTVTPVTKKKELMHKIKKEEAYIENTSQNIYGNQEEVSEKSNQSIAETKTSLVKFSDLSEVTRQKKEMGYVKGGTKKPTAPKQKDAALDFVKAKYKGQMMRSGSNQPKKVKGAKSNVVTGKYKKAADQKKQTASDAKKRGFKSTQNYVDTMARYGGKDNYDKGRGLGT